MVDISKERAAIASVVVVVVIIVLSLGIYYGTESDDTSLPPGPLCPGSLFLGTSSSTVKCFDIEEDNEDITSMTNYAAENDFDDVWSTLEENPYLVNVIHEFQSFALLHLAVNHSNLDAVSQLVSFPSCDVKVKSVPNKQGQNGGKIPEDLAVNSEIFSFLEAITEQQMLNRFGSTQVFFTTQALGENYNAYGLPLLLITMSAYKKTFLGSTLSPSYIFKILLETAFNRPNITLEQVEDIIIDTLYGFDAGSASELEVSTKEEFYGTIVKLYTKNSFYAQLNQVMRRESLFDYDTYRPRSIALHFGPYALMLDSVLTYWSVLAPFNKTAYRGISTDITAQYHVGMIFVYLDFASSSDDINVARIFAGSSGTDLTTDNSEECQWQPRAIAKFSQYPDERGYLYPSGTEFYVTSINGKDMELKLLKPNY